MLARVKPERTPGHDAPTRGPAPRRPPARPGPRTTNGDTFCTPHVTARRAGGDPSIEAGPEVARVGGPAEPKPPEHGSPRPRRPPRPLLAPPTRRSSLRAAVARPTWFSEGAALSPPAASPGGPRSSAGRRPGTRLGRLFSSHLGQHRPFPGLMRKDSGGPRALLAPAGSTFPPGVPRLGCGEQGARPE